MHEREEQKKCLKRQNTRVYKFYVKINKFRFYGFLIILKLFNEHKQFRYIYLIHFFFSVDAIAPVVFVMFAILFFLLPFSFLFLYFSFSVGKLKN